MDSHRLEFEKTAQKWNRTQVCNTLTHETNPWSGFPGRGEKERVSWPQVVQHHHHRIISRAFEPEPNLIGTWTGTQLSKRSRLQPLTWSYFWNLEGVVQRFSASYGRLGQRWTGVWFRIFEEFLMCSTQMTYASV
jgi:hypothetical protein